MQEILDDGFIYFYIWFNYIDDYQQIQHFNFNIT